MFNLALLVIVFVLITCILIFGAFRTWKIQNSPYRKLFLSGRIPNPKPDGFYKGSIEGLKTSWQGKKFDVSFSTGVNLFNNKEIYPFKTYVGKGLQDNKQNVLRIDYNISKNPFWLRFILDEIVEIEPNQYLGKVHLKIIPRLPFSLGYFRLKK